jgi:hypothetical protein
MFGIKKSHFSDEKKNIDFKKKSVSEEDLSDFKSESGPEVTKSTRDSQKNLKSDTAELKQAAEKLKTENKQPDERKEVDIEKYEDPEGLTIKKMELGLWLVEHRRQLLRVPVILLVLISVVTWIYAIYGFGRYLIRGMKEDRQLAYELVQSYLPGHDFFLSRSARALQYQAVQTIKAEEGKYDFVVMISNPNNNYWVEFNYFFQIGDFKFGQADSFILPGETKYLTALGREFNQQPTGAKFYINNIHWARINLHKYPDWQKYRNEHLDIAINDVKFTPAKATILTEKLNLNDLHFKVTNNTAYNYWEVYFHILLFRQNKIIGFNKYTINNFMSGQEYEVDVTWLGIFGPVDDTIIIPEINITRDDIYIKFQGEMEEEK